MRYLKAFLQDPYVASLLPTGKYACRKIVASVDFQKARLIVEYGPGDGVLTRRMLSRMRPDARLVAIETNPALCLRLEEIKDSRLRVCRETVENVVSILAGQQADYVVSGIPFSMFSEQMKRRILRDTARVLNPDGAFVVYQTTPLLLNRLKRYYGRVSMRVALFNVFPLFIMTGRYRI